MRIVDILLAFPAIVFALLLVSIAGPRAAGLSWSLRGHARSQVARVMRSSALDICEKDFVKAVELNRIPSRKIIQGELCPTWSRPSWSRLVCA